MLVRPECERHRGEFIDFRNGEAAPGEIDSLQISAAGTTRFHANVLELRVVYTHNLSSRDSSQAGQVIRT